MGPSAAIGTADISPCGRYRYALTRCWDRADERACAMALIMLNPSGADGSSDDPTLRRCVALARRHGANRLAVGNLFALRATSPDDLKRADDPYGPQNEAALHALIAWARAHDASVICAWGARGGWLGADRRAMRLLAMSPVSLFCLGLTKMGQPRHPLYVPARQSLLPFDPQRT